MPSETIFLKADDCEEHAFVLCSLLRAVGLDHNEVFVALGTYEDYYGHAWVEWCNGQYYVLEATLSRAPAGVPVQGYPYDPWILFNDCNVRELKPGFIPSRKNAREKIGQIGEFYGIKV